MSTPVSALDLQNAPPPPLPIALETITLPSDPWSNARSRAIAVGNFQEMESFRSSSGHDTRLQIAEELYYGWQPKRYWEGTRIPRSSLGVPISMDQVEALMPPIMGSIFPLRDNVEIAPNPGTSVQEAQAAFDVVMSQMDSAQVREKVRIAVKHGLIFGNGILELCWKYEKVQRRRVVAEWQPVVSRRFDEMSGMIVPFNTGQTRRVLREVVDEVEVNVPYLENVAPQDFYIDPNLESNDIQQARMCARRNYVTIAELKLKRGQPGFDIPSDEVLKAMAKHKPGSSADSIKASGETFRYGAWSPQNDASHDPDTWRLEVIRYYTKDRCIWMLNRSWVAYNAANSYGFIPFLNAFYVDVPNRFYGYAVTDAVEAEQRFQQATINAYIDELNLSINSPFTMTNGAASLNQGNLRWAPNKVFKIEKEGDLKRLEMGNGAFQFAAMAIEASDRRAQKRTGVSDLSVLGTSSAGGNSANRTATGVGVQDKAASQRIKYQVENLESNFIEPMLKMVLMLNQLFLNPMQVLQICGQDGQAYQIDPLNVINADVKFRVRGSDKMRSRMMVAQMLPLLTQTYLNPAFVQMASQLGKAPSFKQWDRLISDSMQVPPMSLWEDVTPQQQQALMQQQMGPEIIKAQVEQAKLQQQAQIHDSSDQTDLLKTVMGLVPPEAMHALMGTQSDKAMSLTHKAKGSKSK